MSEFAIETEDLRKVFRSRWGGREVCAVDGIYLRVRRGTTFGLLGPNGAGKTTLVKMLLSAVHPTSGIARIFGKSVSDPQSRRNVGYLPENHRFPTYLTGRGMLDFYGGLSGLDGATRKKRIPELLELVGLEKWGDVRLGKYSKGMLQRVGLAQALIHEPTLLILDEPSDGVDPVGRKHIRDILARLEQRGVTIFLNSHLLVEVELFCREVTIIHRGKKVLEGSVSELTKGGGYKLTVPSSISDNTREEVARTATTVASNNGVVEFHFAARGDANAAIDLLRSRQQEIESMSPTRNTLEEVFIRTING